MTVMVRRWQPKSSARWRQSQSGAATRLWQQRGCSTIFRAWGEI